MRFVVTLFLTAILSGCMKMAEPLGSEPFELVPSDWNGTWCPTEEFVPTPDDGIGIDPAGCIVITVVDPGGGILEIDVGAKPMRVHARSTRGSDAIVSAETPAGYDLGGRVRRQGRTIVLWPSNEGEFRAEVRAGRFPGRFTRYSVWLDALDASHLELIEDEKWRFFAWDEPLILLKVAGPQN